MKSDTYSVILVWSDEDEAFIATVPELDGCHAHGETRVEAIREVEVAIENWLDTARELGRGIPAPKHWAEWEIQSDQGAREELKKALQEAIAENASAITEALAKEIAKSGEDVSTLWHGHTFWWLTRPAKKPIDRDQVPAEPKESK